MLSALRPLPQHGLHRITVGRFSISALNNANQTFYHRDLQINEAKPEQRKPLPKKDQQLGFGALFSDHMLEIDYDRSKGWTNPIIHPYGNFSIDPASKLQQYKGVKVLNSKKIVYLITCNAMDAVNVMWRNRKTPETKTRRKLIKEDFKEALAVLHYACELFEGLKAYRGDDDRIRLFRPEMNMARMRRSAARSALPDFDGKELLECIKELIRIDQAWVPDQKGASLYIRPTIIGTEPMLGVHTSATAKLFVITGPAGAYFDTFAPVSLLADPQYIRAAKGGVGAFKMGCNYAPTLKLGELAKEKGCHQVLWLAGQEHHVTEAGAMNVFMYWKNERGEDELITASLESGIILPGVTRNSILELSREMGGFKVTERDFTMNELRKAVKENRVYEMFGAGTAVVVTPIDQILYEINGHEEKLKIPLMDSGKSLMQRLFKAITDIQFGRTPRPQWTVEI